jgi:hypothetical protein
MNVAHTIPTKVANSGWTLIVWLKAEQEMFSFGAMTVSVFSIFGRLFIGGIVCKHQSPFAMLLAGIHWGFSPGAQASTSASEENTTHGIIDRSSFKDVTGNRGSEVFTIRYPFLSYFVSKIGAIYLYSIPNRIGCPEKYPY